MSEQSTFERVRDILIELSGLYSEEIKFESSLVELGLDSLDRAEVIMYIEEEFGLDIEDDKAETIKTVEDAVKLIDELLKE